MRYLQSSQPGLLKAATGLIAGTVATGPMTVAMILWHRRLPASQRYPLPPREITARVAHKLGVRDEMDETTESAATLVAHFGYGAVAGLVYAFLAGNLRAGALLKGMLFGCFVWAISYLGLLPASGILTPATEHPKRRNLLMIGVHLVWGSVLGGLMKLFEEESHPARDRRAFTSKTTPFHDVRGTGARVPRAWRPGFFRR